MKTLLVAVIAMVVLGGQQPREGARIPSGTAVLSGTVLVDEPNGPPVRRALLALSVGGDLRTQVQTATDDKGRFVFTGLPPGNVRLVASKPGYAMTYYGARQPGSTIGMPIALANGQTADVTLRMARGAVIAGTVSDENGVPMPGVAVRVQRVTVSALGQRMFTASTGVYIPSTDDRGAYRVFGLAAGDYVVTAQPRLGSGGGDVRQTTAAELQWAERQMRGGGGTATASDNVAAPPASQAITYASVYYPGAVSSANAGIVSVPPGQERTGIDLRMQFVATARVEGTITGADGQPARGLPVMLIPESDVPADSERMMVLIEVGMISTSMATTPADGSFSLQNVEPGAYTVLARVGATAGRGAGPATPPGSWAMTDIRVDGRDITGLAMQLAPGLNVSGRVAYDAATQPATAPRVTVSIRAATTRGIGVSSPSAPLLAPDDAFTASGLIPAAYRVAASAPGWTLKSAVLGTRDVADTPFEIKAGENTSGLVLTFTDSPAEVSGVLYDGANRPSSDLSMVLFSTDRSMWFSGSRRVRPVTRPASDGRFTFSGLVAGEYYLAALTDVQPNDLANAQFLEQVQAAAIKVVVAHGEKKTQDLKIAR